MVAASRPYSSVLAGRSGARDPTGLSLEAAASGAAGREKTSRHEYPASHSFQNLGRTPNAPQSPTGQMAQPTPPPVTRFRNTRPHETDAQDTKAARVDLTIAASPPAVFCT